MDSGNSGSIQSSSGGDEEYDSRAAVESISAFMNPPPPPHHQNAVPSAAIFDPLISNYLNQQPPQPLQSQQHNTLLNLDMVWSKNIIRSDRNFADISSIFPSSSTVQPFFGSLNPQLPALPFPPPAVENNTNMAAAAARMASSSPPSTATIDQNKTASRNPKKRSRASRRAPTTVLTTDTTNFRAMVQEFTGIPSSPFTSSAFPRSRLDLFGRSSPLDTSQPSFLLRPFAQKIQPPPPPIAPPSLPPPFVSSAASTAPLSSSLLINAIGSTSANANNSSSNIIPSGSASSNVSTNYQMQPSELGLLKQPQTSDLLSMQNPIFTFQSLLQPPPKYPLTNSNIVISKPQGSLEITSGNSHLKIGGPLDTDHHHHHFGLSHGDHVENNAHLSSLPSLGNVARNGNKQPNWGDGNGDPAQLRSCNNGNNDFEISRGGAVANGKLNLSASSSNFRGNKGVENMSASTRGEGMRESWICSSD